MLSLANCTLSEIIGAEKSLRLIPSGSFRSKDSRPVNLPYWIMTASNATNIVNAAALLQDDFVIDYEHQTMQTSQNGQPAPAAGWFKRLEWREGLGLYAVDVRWTARASAMIIAGEYRYLSPVFSFDANTGEVKNLHSAALTNNPALDGLTNIAAARCGAVKTDPKSSMSQFDKDHANRIFKQVFGKDASLIK